MSGSNISLTAKQVNQSIADLAAQIRDPVNSSRGTAITDRQFERMTDGTVSHNDLDIAKYTLNRTFEVTDNNVQQDKLKVLGENPHCRHRV